MQNKEEENLVRLGSTNLKIPLQHQVDVPSVQRVQMWKEKRVLAL